MRIILPERIPLKSAIGCALGLLALQLLEGTSVGFVLLHFAFVVLWVLAFNTAGGFTRASGAYVFWYGLFTVLLGTALRALIGQAGDDRSASPMLTMALYTISMAGLTLVLLATSRMTRNVISLSERTGSYRMNYRNAGAGCLAIGLFVSYGGPFLPAGGGPFFAALYHSNLFPLLAIILGTIEAVQASGGKRCTNWINVIAFFSAFLYGLAGFSKEGMFTPAACFLIGVSFARFRLGRLQVVALALFFIAAQMVLYPVAQVGRTLYVNASLGTRMAGALDLLVNIKDTRQVAADNTPDARTQVDQYFNQDLGLAYRFTRWPGDDLLIDYSTRNRYEGYGYLRWTLINWFPHLIFPGKDKLVVDGGGNYYAREMGMLNPGDHTTGISFGPPAESFHMGGWIAVCLMLPAVWFPFLLSIEFVCGDLRRAPWGLFYAVLFSHMAPETGLAGILSFIWFDNFSLFACMILATTMAPVLGSAFSTRMRTARQIGADNWPRASLPPAAEMAP